MAILRFLQQNAEWMCAIAIVIFTAVQCWLAYQQNLQNIRMKRLELANGLDRVCTIFAGEKEHAKRISEWLMSNASNFIFLLNKKDRAKYMNFAAFLYNYCNHTFLGQVEVIQAMKDFNKLLYELELVLGNAKYGLINEQKELEAIEKAKRIANGK